MEIREPKITIITVAYNAEKTLESTIKSVLSQSYNNLEYIIIDGASSDSSLQIINKYKDRIILISEPDRGVYDAMNKGINLASGEWLLFMNAGDHFFTSSVISDVMENSHTFDDYAVIYGDAEFRLKNIAYINIASDHVSSNQFMPFSHQAAFTRTNIAKQTRFDTSFKIAADAAFFLRLTRDGYQMKHIPITICSYNALEGLSADNDVKRSEEIVAIQAKWNNINPCDPHFTKYIDDAKKRERIKKILPNFIWIALREESIRKKYEKDRIRKIR